MMTSREIYDIIKSNEHKFLAFGLRTCNDDLAIGDELAASRDLSDDAEPDSLLDGTSATGFDYLWLYDEPSVQDIADDVATIEKALETNATYPGRRTYLVAGQRSSYGQDEDEIVIANAEVVAIIK